MKPIIATTNGSSYEPPFPIKHCAKCGKLRQIRLKNKLLPDLCRSCYNSLESRQCNRCGIKRLLVNETTGLCPKCAAKPEGECAHCHSDTFVFDKDDSLCWKCYHANKHKLWKQARKKVCQCSSCGEVRAMTPLARENSVCWDCYMEELNGRAACAGCRRMKVIYSKELRLCRSCKSNHYSPRSLAKFIKEFTTPYLYNKELFDIAVTTINWEAVTQELVSRFRHFGRFLQSREIPEPLTWDVIHEVRPKLGRERRTEVGHVRRCLRDVGDRLVAAGKLEEWSSYVLRRRNQAALRRAPAHVKILLEKYVGWLEGERYAKPRSVGMTISYLTEFWRWCLRKGIKEVAELQPSDVRKDYVFSLYWQWECCACRATTPIESRGSRPLPLCPNCNAAHTVAKVGRYSREAVRRRVQNLRSFFHWARVNRLVVAKIAPPKVKARQAPIRHYPPEVMERLSAGISSPDADPIEALTLYLIIFYGFTLWELRNAQVPVVFPLHQSRPLSTLAESYHLVVPNRPPSVFNHNPGRPGQRVDFRASASPWLKPLLKRYDEQRRSVVRHHENKYLYVIPQSVRRNTPVSMRVVREIIRRASLKAVGADCTPQTLRLTAMTLLADSASGSILHNHGIKGQRAFFFDWAARELVQPEEPGERWVSNAKGRRIPVAPPATLS